MISFSYTTHTPATARTKQTVNDSVLRSTMSLAPNLVSATNSVRESLDETTPFLRKISIFQAGINRQIENIENTNKKYLNSKKLKFLEKHPFLKSNNDTLFEKLKLSQLKLSDALAKIVEQSADTLPPAIQTLLDETQNALTACKDSLSAISGHETKSMSDKKFALIAVCVNFVSSAAVPCVVQALAATGVIFPTIGLAIAASSSPFLAAPVLTAVVGVIVGAVTLAVGIRLYHYYKSRSEDSSHKLDNTELALEELGRCLTVMDESLGISQQSFDHPMTEAINAQQLAPDLAEALKDENMVAFRKFLSFLIDKRDVIGSLDVPVDIDKESMADAISIVGTATEMVASPVPTRAQAEAAMKAATLAATLAERTAYFREVRELTRV